MINRDTSAAPFFAAQVDPSASSTKYLWRPIAQLPELDAVHLLVFLLALRLDLVGISMLVHVREEKLLNLLPILYILIIGNAAKDHLNELIQHGD